MGIEHCLLLLRGHLFEPLVFQRLTRRKSVIRIHHKELLDQVYDFWGAIFEFNMIKVIFACLYFIKDLLSIIALKW